MRKINWPLVIAIAVMSGLIAFLYSVRISVARDLGQWEQTDPLIRHWYRSLMQPDNPAKPCCGEADAYWADSYEVKDGQYVAIITDDRPDAPLGREHVEVGTRILIPNEKLKYDQSNPTGHGIVFLSRGGFVWCYLAPMGT